MKAFILILSLFLTACNVGWKNEDINKIGEEHDLFTLLKANEVNAELKANGKMVELDHLIDRINDYPDFNSTIIHIKKATFKINDLIIFKLRDNLTANFNVKSVIKKKNDTEVMARILHTANITGTLKIIQADNYKNMRIDYDNKSLFLKKHYEIVPAYVAGVEDKYRYYLLLDVPITLKEIKK